MSDLLRSHGVRAAYLYGSVLQSTASRLSDLDIAVLLPPDPQGWTGRYGELHGDLCQLFEADNIDLVTLDQAPLSLQARVVLAGVRFLGEKDAAGWEERVLARYADLAPWRQGNWNVTRQLARRGAIGEVNLINRERVERWVFLIRDAVGELQALSLGDAGLQTAQVDKHTRALCEHYLRIAIEATLDLGRHVIVQTGLGLPQEYRDVGKILREREIVPADLGTQLEAMAGMRNVLVHLYWDIDHALLYKAIVEQLHVFGQCIEHIFEYLDKLGDKDS